MKYKTIYRERNLTVYDVKNLKRRDRRAMYRTDVTIASVLQKKEQKTLQEWQAVSENETARIMVLEGELKACEDIWEEYQARRTEIIKELMDSYSVDYWQQHVKEKAPTVLGSYKDIGAKK